MDEDGILKKAREEKKDHEKEIVFKLHHRAYEVIIHKHEGNAQKQESDFISCGGKLRSQNEESLQESNFCDKK